MNGQKLTGQKKNRNINGETKLQSGDQKAQRMAPGTTEMSLSALDTREGRSGTARAGKKNGLAMGVQNGKRRRAEITMIMA